jgi:hypothetical protein
VGRQFVARHGGNRMIRRAGPQRRRGETPRRGDLFCSRRAVRWPVRDDAIGGAVAIE